MDFTNARHIARMSRLEVMEYLQISKSTLYRYETTGKAPKPIIECLLMIGGRLPSFEYTKRKNDFTGWSFSNGYLYSDSGYRFTSGDILAIYPERELIKELTRKNKQMKKQLANRVSTNVIPFPSKRNKQKQLA